jgi:hypothetical protein
MTSGSILVGKARSKAAKALLQPSIFTIVIDDKPILSFEAQNIREAFELARERWLLDDLAKARADGVPLWQGKAKVRARLCTHDEAASYSASPTSTDGDIKLVYLVKRDSGDSVNLDGGACGDAVPTPSSWRSSSGGKPTQSSFGALSIRPEEVLPAGSSRRSRWPGKPPPL